MRRKGSLEKLAPFFSKCTVVFIFKMWQASPLIFNFMMNIRGAGHLISKRFDYSLRQIITHARVGTQDKSLKNGKDVMVNLLTQWPEFHG